jgi:hypothetical protein
LAEKSCQNSEGSKIKNAEFGADLLNSFLLSTRLTVRVNLGVTNGQAIEAFLKLIVWIPHHQSEDIGGLPVNVNLYSDERLAALKAECLEIVALVFASRSFQTNVARSFATGDVDFLTNDYFSPVVEKLLLLTPQNQKGILTLYSLTLDVVRSVTTALDGVLSALPLSSVATTLETFVKTKRDAIVTAKMMSIASERLLKVSTSDLTIKAPLAQLLSLLNDVIQSSQDIDATEVALECIAKLSRVHGKAQLLEFENTLPTIIKHGINSHNDLTIQRSLDCLLSMLYLTFPAYAECSPILGARIVMFLPEIMPVIFEQLEHVNGKI